MEECFFVRNIENRPAVGFKVGTRKVTAARGLSATAARAMFRVSHTCTFPKVPYAFHGFMSCELEGQPSVLEGL